MPAIAFVTRRVYHDVETLIAYRYVRSVLIDAKFGGDRRELAALARHLLDLALDSAQDLVDWHGVETIELVLIPSSPLRYLRHGFDHMRVIAKHMQALAGGGVHIWYGFRSPLRRRLLLEAPQSRTSGPKRKLSDPFVARAGFQGRHLVVIDDVSTTGSTLAAARRTLSIAGIHTHAITFAFQQQHPALQKVPSL